MPEFLSSDFAKLTLPLAASWLAAVAAWFVNERRKRAQEEYVRKEEKYKALLSSIRGFYAESHDATAKQAFLDQLRQCWLYCPDEVIHKANAFLQTVAIGANSKEAALGELVAAIRRDMLSRKGVRGTRLQGKDFGHWGTK
jgi:hypothetical protein